MNAVNFIILLVLVVAAMVVLWRAWPNVGRLEHADGPAHDLDRDQDRTRQDRRGTRLENRFEKSSLDTLESEGGTVRRATASDDRA